MSIPIDEIELLHILSIIILLEIYQLIHQGIREMDGFFSHFIEHWISNNYPLTHVDGCKSHDFIDINDSTILYDEKTFTKGGCNFCPSNMLGQGRKFDKEVFTEKTKKLIFCIVSNVYSRNKNKVCKR